MLTAFSQEDIEEFYDEVKECCPNDVDNKKEDAHSVS